MIKIIIACDNDKILLSKLKNIAQIELIYVKINVEKIIKSFKQNSPDMLILDFDKKILTKEKIIEKISKLSLNKRLIISVTDSRTYLCFDQTYLLLKLIKILEDFTDVSLENAIHDMLWKLHFNLYSKGTIYLKEAIIVAYYNRQLLLDTKKLINEIAQKHNSNSKNIRNNIDNALNLAFKYENLQYDIDFFNGYYDGRKISLKYFISLAVHYIESTISKKNSNIKLKS